jgi:hypothetical protein
LELTNGKQTPDDVSTMRAAKDWYLWAATLVAVKEHRELGSIPEGGVCHADIVERNILKASVAVISVDDLKTTEPVQSWFCALSNEVPRECKKLMANGWSRTSDPSVNKPFVAQSPSNV